MVGIETFLISSKHSLEHKTTLLSDYLRRKFEVRHLADVLHQRSLIADSALILPNTQLRGRSISRSLFGYPNHSLPSSSQKKLLMVIAIPSPPSEIPSYVPTNPDHMR